jgi:DNA-binding LacI/PurR family transcriptional regulator
MRSLASAAGVSPTAVSLALRSDPSIPARTRNRIQRIARAHGYRPDPVLTHLMQHLRSSRTTRAVANLAVFAPLQVPFTHRLVAGAEARAARLGYALNRIDLNPFQGQPAALTRILLARGIAGLLLAPSACPSDYSELIDWSKFAAVAMTYSVFAPRVHRVVTHHYDNAVRTFGLLQERGCTRIGLAMAHDLEIRANHSYSGAYARIAATAGGLIAPILFVDTASRREIQEWFDSFQPDAIVVANSVDVRECLLPALGLRRCIKTAFASLDDEVNSEIAGIDQLFETVGSHAVDALVTQLHCNEFGLPAHPTIGMVEGQWSERGGLYPFAAKAPSFRDRPE